MAHASRMRRGVWRTHPACAVEVAHASRLRRTPWGNRSGIWLEIQTVRIQQEIENAHGEDAVVVIERCRRVQGDNDLFE